MNKSIYLTILGMSVVAGLTSCDSVTDDVLSGDNYADNNVISVTTNIEPLKSRAGHTADNINDLGLIIVNSANSAYSYNKQLVANNGAWACADGQPMLWDVNKTPVTVTAVAPYKSAMASSSTFDVAVATDQTTDDAVRLSDLLTYKGVVNPANQLAVDGKLPLTFNHALSKLIVQFTVNKTDKADMALLGDVAINGAVVAGKCDLTPEQPKVTVDGSASPSTITPFKGSEACECIIVPQTIASNFSVNFTYNGHIYTWTSPASTTLESGYEYRLTLNINSTVSMTARGSRQWTPDTNL